jgi:tetratricopeptide (TPR) repeat protein
MSINHSPSFDASSVARKHMLRMARDLQQEGQVYSAIYLLKRLLDDYPETPESRIAIQEYAALGEFFESKGMIHTALSMYEWLEQLS